jgi:hypothetical protein
MRLGSSPVSGDPRAEKNPLGRKPNAILRIRRPIWRFEQHLTILCEASLKACLIKASRCRGRAVNCSCEKKAFALAKKKSTQLQKIESACVKRPVR